MPRATVVIWCDLGPRQGVGHLMRCLALAEEISARGRRVVFLVDASRVPFARRQLEARGLEAVAPPRELDDQVALVESLDPEAVVIDSYALPAEAYRRVRERRRTLALVDGDLGGREADLYLDQNIGAEDDRHTLPPGSERLAGLGFALMRDDVLAHRPAAPRPAAAREDAGRPVRVFAFFGGTDPYGAAPLVADALLRTGVAVHLVVVAASDDARAGLTSLRPGPDQGVEVIAPTDRLPELVGSADLVLSAAGTSSWELLCLGAAVGFVCVADNQAEGYARTVAGGWGLGLGTLEELRADPSHAIEVLRPALRDAELRARLREQGWRLVDGRGRQRVVDRLLVAGTGRSS